MQKSSHGRWQKCYQPQRLGKVIKAEQNKRPLDSKELNPHGPLQRPALDSQDSQDVWPTDW
ncbi:hypothetical protein D0440_26060 [Priestia megaterium]|nr:hypothetical protein D0440_26060 [Priestia megaterium]